MTSTSKIGSIFLPDTLEMVKAMLNRQYGDHELHDTIYLLVSSVMAADASLFGQAPHQGDILVVANLLGGIFAEYVNEGIIDPEKASAYVTRINNMTPEEIAEEIKKVTRQPDGLRAN